MAISKMGLLIKVKNFYLDTTKNTMMIPKDPISMYFEPLFHLHHIRTLYYKPFRCYSKELHQVGMGNINLT